MKMSPEAPLASELVMLMVPLSEAVAVPEVMFTRPPGAALVLAPPSMVMSPPLPVEVVPTKS